MFLKSERGFTLIEIIIVIVILSIVSAITIYFLINSLKVYTMTVNQKTILDEGKLALERMCRDIRDAKAISFPIFGGSGSSVVFQRTNATRWDIADEWITYYQNGRYLERVKSSPSATNDIAFNVSTFTVTRALTNEITLVLTLSLSSGENVTLQTKVYPKNLPKSTTYKNFFQNWKEDISS
jgi:prepilin-type N-terminal cleavage/methylation domain-containing protein